MGPELSARCKIEGLCLREAIEKGGVEWEAQVTAALHRVTHFAPASKPVGSEQMETFSKVHGAFHETLAAGCNNPWLMQVRALLFSQSTIPVAFQFAAWQGARPRQGALRSGPGGAGARSGFGSAPYDRASAAHGRRHTRTCEFATRAGPGEGIQFGSFGCRMSCQPTPQLHFHGRTHPSRRPPETFRTNPETNIILETKCSDCLAPGVWKSARNIVTMSPSPTFGTPPGGQIQYTDDGRMSAFLMDPAWAARLAPDADPGREFLAYAGNCTIKDGLVHHLIDFCSFPRFIGSTFTRKFNFRSENELHLTTVIERSKSGASYFSELVWTRCDRKTRIVR